MKQSAITALLSDPNIDPTSWLGGALISWIQKNYSQVFEDKTARKYIINGMELREFDSVAKMVRNSYEKEEDLSLVLNYLDKLNKESNFVDPTSWQSNSINHAIKQLEPIIAKHPSTIDLLIDNKHWQPSHSIIPALRPRHVDFILTISRPNWGVVSWAKFLALIPNDSIMEFTATKLWPYIAKQTTSYYSTMSLSLAQNILYQAFLKLPEKDSSRWLRFLETVDTKPLWDSSKSSYERYVSKNVVGTIKLDSCVCRCGRVSANRSGHTNHYHQCYEMDPIKNMKGSDDNVGVHAINLYDAAVVFNARNVELQCSKCGIMCKSSSGLTLHTKKCSSNLGDSVTEHRRSRKEVYDNKDED